MKVLVTGGTGFVGSNIVKALLARGDEVLMTGNDAEQKIPEFKGVYLQPSFLGLDWERIGHVDVLFHQAALNDTTLMDKKEMFRANVDAPKALFEYVVKNGCKKIVYASSTAVYGDSPAPYIEGKALLHPLNPYGESKKAFEEFATEFAALHPDVVVVGLRYCNVFGPGESHKGKRATMIPQLAKQMQAGNPKLFSASTGGRSSSGGKGGSASGGKDGEQKRDYIYVGDVVTANLLAAKAKESCIVNCGYGKATSFNDLVKILNSVLRLNRTPEYIDNPYRAFYQNYTECDMSLAKEKIGFVPEFDIEKGIRDYFESGYLV